MSTVFFSFKFYWSHNYYTGHLDNFGKGRDVPTKYLPKCKSTYNWLGFIKSSKHTKGEVSDKIPDKPNINTNSAFDDDVCLIFPKFNNISWVFPTRVCIHPSPQAHLWNKIIKKCKTNRKWPQIHTVNNPFFDQVYLTYS